MTLYDSRMIAREFLERANKEGKNLTPIQLVKLVYIAHGWHLLYFDSPLFEESVACLKYGPNVTKVYNEVRFFQVEPIPSDIIYSLPLGKFSEKVTELIDVVWKSYKNFSGVKLAAICNSDDSPWFKAKNSYLEYVPNYLIKQHFTEKVMNLTFPKENVKEELQKEEIPF